MDPEFLLGIVDQLYIPHVVETERIIRRQANNQAAKMVPNRIRMIAAIERLIALLRQGLNHRESRTADIVETYTFIRNALFAEYMKRQERLRSDGKDRQYRYVKDVMIITLKQVRKTLRKAANDDRLFADEIDITGFEDYGTVEGMPMVPSLQFSPTLHTSVLHSSRALRH